MNIYVLLQLIPYSGDKILAVYTNYDMAMSVLRKLLADFPGDTYRLEDYDADSWTYDGVYK